MKQVSKGSASREEPTVDLLLTAEDLLDVYYSCVDVPEGIHPQHPVVAMRHVVSCASCMVIAFEMEEIHNKALAQNKSLHRH